jgi:O-antigen/teichoic acid export membrane protein
MGLSSGTRRVLKNATFIYGSSLINQLSRAIYVVVLARNLGPDLYGLLYYGQAWYLVFLPVGLLGLGPVLVSTIGRDHVEGKLTAHRVAAIRSLALVAVAIISAGLGWYTVDTGTLATLLVIFAFALIGRACSMWADELFQAYESTYFCFRQERLFRTAEVILGIFLVLLTGDVVIVAISHAGIWLVQGARGLYLVYRHLQPISFLWQWRQIRLLLIAGTPIGLSLVLDTILLQGGVILYRLSGAPDELVGNLGILVQAVVILGTAFEALSRAALPAISRSVDRGDVHHRLYLSGMIRIAFVFGSLAGIWAIAIGHDLVGLLLGPEYEPAALGLGLMLWLVIPYIIKQASLYYLVAQARYALLLWLSLSGAVALAAAITLLTGPYGMIGVIAAIIFGYCVNVGLALLILNRLGLVDHFSDVPKMLAVLSGSLLAVTGLMNAQPWLAGLVATGILFAGTLRLGVLRENEKTFLIGLVRRRE